MYNKAHKDGEGVDEQLHGVTVSSLYIIWGFAIIGYL